MTAAKDSQLSEEPASIYKGEAILRAAKALACFTAEKPVWTLAELSTATGTPRDTLRGILNTLTAHDMLRRNEHGAYQLGFAWLRLGTLRRNQFDARTIALPLMRSIRDSVNETVILSMRVGDQRVHIDYVESTHPIRRLAQIGSNGPLYWGATGLALLNTLPHGELAAYLEQIKKSLAPSVYKKVERDLAAVAHDGVAVVVGLVNTEMAAVAAATRLFIGESIALTISCPVDRFTSELKRSCCLLLKEAVSQLSTRLGSRL
jgi:DNA-binding IclR family transcriptional regulator